jgi:hypothetical protein
MILTRLIMSYELSISVSFGITLEYVDPLWPTVMTPLEKCYKTYVKVHIPLYNLFFTNIN